MGVVEACNQQPGPTEGWERCPGQGVRPRSPGSPASSLCRAAHKAFSHPVANRPLPPPRPPKSGQGRTFCALRWAEEETEA